MANEIKLKRGSGSDPGASDLSVGEVAIRTDNGKLFTKRDNGTVTEITGGGGIDDGDKGDITVSNSGATFTIDSGVINNAKIASDAAIQGSKISPDFGSQTVTTTGTVNTGVINASTSSDQILNLNSSDSNAVYLAYKRGGSRKAYIGYGGTGNTLSFVNEISDGDINISGSDGGSQINVLNFDVSDTGKATFSGAVHASNGFVGNVTGNASGSSGSCTGNAATATALETARNIGGVSFDGTGNINLPGVNTSGNQDTTGNAATATTSTRVTVTDNSSDTSCFVLFTQAATGNQLPHSGSNLTFNASSGLLTATGFAGALTGNVTGNASGSSGSCTGNAATATALETARTIAGVSFDGSANISLNNNAITNGAGYITDVVNDTSPQLGGDLASNGNNIRFGDSSDGSSDDVLSFGAGNDLLIYHYSDSSYIQDNGTGPLQIYTNGTDIRFKTSDGETMTKMIKDGAVELYHNASLKCETTSSGIDVTGNIVVSGTVDGRDLATDGTKLDGIASGATNVTNNNQLTNGAGYITATLTNEQVQDIVGAMVSGNTETGISVTYQDGDGTLDFAVSSQTDENFTTTLKNKLDGIAAGATNVTNNNQLTNGAGYITSASDNTKLPLSGGELTGDLITHEVRPDGNNTRSLGTSSKRWSNVFTNDLHLSNKGGSNKVDNTWGDFTIQEGSEDLFLINNRNGKMFKFVLQEVN